MPSYHPWACRGKARSPKRIFKLLSEVLRIPRILNPLWRGGRVEGLRAQTCVRILTWPLTDFVMCGTLLNPSWASLSSPASGGYNSVHLIGVLWGVNAVHDPGALPGKWSLWNKTNKKMSLYMQQADVTCWLPRRVGLLPCPLLQAADQHCPWTLKPHRTVGKEFLSYHLCSLGARRRCLGLGRPGRPCWASP